MKKTLQGKFIFTAMVAVTLLLLVLLGGINLVNWRLVEAQTDQLLRFLTQEESPHGQLGRPQAGRGPGAFLPPLGDDDRGSARFFQVFYDSQGQVAYVDIRQIATVTEEEAVAYGARCQGKDQGTIDRFRFRRTATRDGRGEVLLFLDISANRRDMLAVLAVSAGIGALCWLGSLLLVVLLSRRAIAPMARSFEKQRQFVTNAGHELKTPLAILRANTEAMELRQGQTKWSRNILDQVQRLTGLMEHLLTLARLDEAALPPAQAVDLSQLARGACQSFREAAALREISLREEILPDLTIQSSREQMDQLLSILLDNAVKYTDSPGEITLSLAPEGGKVRLQVKNRPAQIPKGDLARLFDRFYRDDAARTQGSGGYGIGLSAARAIVQAWKGSLSAHREGEDTMVFTARL